MKKSSVTGGKSTVTNDSNYSTSSTSSNENSTSEEDALVNVDNSKKVWLDMPIDPNEPVFCLCQQVSYGEMVMCDDPDVSKIIIYHLSLPFCICIFIAIMIT